MINKLSKKPVQGCKPFWNCPPVLDVSRCSFGGRPSIEINLWLEPRGIVAYISGLVRKFPETICMAHNIWATSE